MYDVIWSYTIYGKNHELYFKPLLEVIVLAIKVGAKVVLNTPDEFYEDVHTYYREYIDQIIILKYDCKIAKISPKILRYLVPVKIKAKYYFYKDSDSVVTEKELKVMKHWMAMTFKDGIIIRDHHLHVSPILAGMFGLIYDAAYEIAILAINNFKNIEKNVDEYAYDQNWLMDKVYSMDRLKFQVYSSYFYFQNETVIQLKREIDSNEHIGAQKFYNSTIKNEFSIWSNIYKGKMLSVPYSKKINHYFPRVIYGRVRPTLLLAYIYSFFKNKDQFTILE